LILKETVSPLLTLISVVKPWMLAAPEPEICHSDDGLPGLVHTSVGCAASFMKYAKLIELNRMRRER